MTNFVKEHSRFLQFLVLFLSVVLLSVRCVKMNGNGVVIDDAFISFRYAKHLSSGQGLVFNIGERVEGYTNFLWVVLLAFSHRLGLNIVWAAKLWAFASALATLILILLTANYLFGIESSPIITAIPIVLFAATPSQARYVVSGMETLLFTCIIIGSIYLFLTEKWIFSGFAFALATMTRPEGVMYFVLTLGFGMLADWIFDNEKFSFKEVAIYTLAFTLVYGSYFYWRHQYFGHLLPNTFYAKASGIYLARLNRGWDLLVQVLGEWRALPWLTLGLFSLTSVSNKKTWLLFLGLILASFVYFVWVGGDFIVWFGPRFLMPILPLMLLLTAQGTQNISQFFPKERPIIKLFFQITVLILLGINTFWFSWAAGFSPEGPFSVQMRGWTHLAHWLAEQSPPDSTIATDAAGIIPYYTNRHSIDMFGLTDEHIAHLNIPTTENSIVAHEKYDPHYILSQEPDYIVSTWLNKQGQPVSAGLSSVRKEVEKSYSLIAVTKVKKGMPTNGNWVIETSTYGKSLYENGYLTGVFQRATPQ